MPEASGLLEISTAGGGGGGAIVSSAVAEAANLTNNEGGGGPGGSVPSGFARKGVRGEEDDRNFAGNRWPREETLVLLKIRSDMDVAFRDATLKAPLWDEVSRKLAELGYHRSAKKSKEKFENIYKYHKRTKECRSGRRNFKNYRFFEQLELLDNQSSLPSPSQDKSQPSLTETTMAMGIEMTTMPIKPPSVTQDVTMPCSIPNPSAEFMMSTSTSTTSSLGKESAGNGKKKRKLGDFFERLMKEVLERQENLQYKFIEALEKREKDRIARDEAWKLQELARLKREQEMLAQDRAISAAKNAAVVAFLQKISGQVSPGQLPENPTPTTPTPTPIPIPIPSNKIIDKQENGIAESTTQVSSSRWPKAETEALIRLRTTQSNLDLQYQDSGAKGPLWEEVSLSMKELGYNRSAKRCKEKWENINKYFKRVKESNRKRSGDSKTCPYFHTLESLYESKSKEVDNSNSSVCNLKPDDILLQMMAQPQQQHQQQRPESVIEDGESEDVDQNQEEAEDDNDDDDDDNGNDYQIVANNPSSLTTWSEEPRYISFSIKS